jgi:hypothetical protein
MSLLALFDSTGTWFTPHQILLIDSLLAEPDLADLALCRWATATKIDDIDHLSFRLLPELCARYPRHTALATIQGRIKGVYRQNFYQNTLLFAHAERIFDRFHSAGIDFVLMKGMAVALLYHGTPARRVLGDCDVLVRLQHMQAAEAILVSEGFRYRYAPEDRVRDRHSHDFVDKAGRGFDLHWYSLLECCEHGMDDGFWQRTGTVSWRGMEIRILSPEDAFIVAGTNGIREPEAMRADWLLDMACLHLHHALDWALIRNELHARRLLPSFLSALATLQRFLPGFPTAKVEQVLAAELRDGLALAVAQNRIYPATPAADQALTAALDTAARLRAIVAEAAATDPRSAIARCGNTARYLRYETHPDGSVRTLRLHRDLRPYLEQIFFLDTPEKLRRAHAEASRPDERHLSFAPGQLWLPAANRLQHYAAEYQPSATELHFAASEQSKKITVGVTNISPNPWREFPTTGYRFGLSYHLFSEIGAVLRWDFDRNFFLPSVLGHIAVLLPGETLDVELAILRPPAPGRYLVRLDIVHEMVAWFDPAALSPPDIVVTAA